MNTKLIEAMVDCVQFEIKKREKDIYWSSKYWGYIKSDKIKLLED